MMQRRETKKKDKVWRRDKITRLIERRREREVKYETKTNAQIQTVLRGRQS